MTGGGGRLRSVPPPRLALPALVDSWARPAAPGRVAPAACPAPSARLDSPAYLDSTAHPAPAVRVLRPAHPALALVLALAGSLLAGAAALAQERPELFGGDFPVSGYHYMGELVRALQDDDFQNPGLFAVEHGAELWAAVEGTVGKSCASCHGDAARSMRGVAARYPAYDPKQEGLVNLELRINEERAEHMGAPALPMESEALLALTAFVTWQSRGMPMKVDISGEAKPYWEDGKAFYERRRGQLDLACSQCHDRLAGARLRGDRISQGHVNGFPFYRLMWRSMGSRHRMFRWCNWAVRAETHELGSPEYLNLELYVAWRGRGLPIEAPAVRP